MFINWRSYKNLNFRRILRELYKNNILVDDANFRNTFFPYEERVLWKTVWINLKEFAFKLKYIYTIAGI